MQFKFYILHYIRRILTNNPGEEDGHLLHTKEMMTMILLWYHYRDLSREGDGDRLRDFMPILLSIFKNAKRSNYSKEVAIFLLQYEYLLSPMMQQQLLFSRTDKNTWNEREKHTM
jgi:hypothetical protein